MIEFYMDDYIDLEIGRSQAKLCHIETGVMTGIQDVFSLYGKYEEYPISPKKILIKEGVWAMVKYILAFNFYGNPGEHTICITKQRQDYILEVRKKWIREGEHSAKGIPFEEFRQYTLKLKNEFISLPLGKGLLSPFNQLLGNKQPKVYLNLNKPLILAIRDGRHLLKWSKYFPTPCKEMIMGWPNYIGVKDALSHGFGGIIVGEDKACVPTVFCFTCNEDIQELYRK